ncbi:MAG: polysaccharide ABC transporter ATP-binding protein [Terricaulis sp.]
MSTPKIPRADILRANRVSKLYARRTQSQKARLGSTITRTIFGLPPPPIVALSAHEFWAVNDVSFHLRCGEALGIVGLNGSGKTTLLRMLAGQVLPDSGEIWINGTSAAMIDLQEGFQQAASGRENIFLRAAALGFPRTQTRESIAEIIAFSELAEAIDAPVASYSSGMKMRLAFSVMTMVAPDVLLIDEVLGVGDFRFRQKCLAKIREMRERSAFVFVSHSMGDVERFCDRVIVLHKGRMHFTGPPREAIEIYETLDDSHGPAHGPINLTRAMGPTFANAQAIMDVEHYWCDAAGKAIAELRFSDPIRLTVRFRAAVDIRNLIIGVPVWNANAQYTTGLSTQMNSESFDIKAGEAVHFALEIVGGLMNPGLMKSMLTILDGAEFFYRQPNPDLIVRAAPHPTWGAVTIPHTWRRIAPLEARTAAH